MGELLPPYWYTFRRREQNGETTFFQASKLNLKAKVTCQQCNNNWMSGLESEAKKPLSSIILSDEPRTLDIRDMAAISAFMFKTTVIANHMSLKVGNRGPYFTIPDRVKFRRELKIPYGTEVFLANRVSRAKRSGRFESAYGIHKHPTNGFELYLCTFGVGHLLLQFRHIRWTQTIRKQGIVSIATNPAIANVATRIWPIPADTVAWPPKLPIIDEFIEAFCDRWRKFEVPAKSFGLPAG